MTKTSEIVVVVASNLRVYCSPVEDELKKLGIKTIYCCNAEQVISKFEDNEGKKPDLLISDCFLVHGNVFHDHVTLYGMRTGLEIYRHLREKDVNIPIILHTTQDADLARIELLSQNDKRLKGFRFLEIKPKEAVQLALKLLGETPATGM